MNTLGNFKKKYFLLKETTILPRDKKLYEKLTINMQFNESTLSDKTMSEKSDEHFVRRKIMSNENFV